MDKKLWTKDKLLTYLMIVSIVTVTIVGLYYLHQLTSGIFYTVLNALSAVLIPFVIAFFLSFIVGPLASWMQHKFKMNANLSIALSIFIGIVFVLMFIALLLIFIFAQVSSVLSSLFQLIDSESIKSIIDEVIVIINQYFQTNSFTEIFDEITANGATIQSVMGLIGTVLLTFTGIASGIFKILAIFVLTPVFMFYLIKEKEYIFQGIAKLFPKAFRVHLIELGKRSDVVIKNYFKGAGIMIGIIAFYFSVTLIILSFFIKGFNIEHAIMFALLMGLMNIIPYIGAWIGLAVPLIFLLTKHLEVAGASNIYLYGMIAVVVIHIIEQALEISIIQPNVLGKQVHIHPLLVLSSLIFFGGIFGFAGVLLAVPLAGTLRAVLKYIEEINDKKPATPTKKKKQTIKQEDTATNTPS